MSDRFCKKPVEKPLQGLDNLLMKECIRLDEYTCTIAVRFMVNGNSIHLQFKECYLFSTRRCLRSLTLLVKPRTLNYSQSCPGTRFGSIMDILYKFRQKV